MSNPIKIFNAEFDLRSTVNFEFEYVFEYVFIFLRSTHSLERHVTAEYKKISDYFFGRKT